MDNSKQMHAIHHLANKCESSDFGRVAVLMGGRSGERAVSLDSGNAVLKALRHTGIDAHPIDPLENFPQNLIAGKFDRVFNILHGTEGEDGVMQGVLEALKLPYTGSGVLASALAMNKLYTKRIWQTQNLSMPEFFVSDSLNHALERATHIGYPLVLKPISQGSSLGVHIVHNATELAENYSKTAAYGEVLVERFIDGAEITVGIIDNIVLPTLCIKPQEGFYDYAAKYQLETTDYRVLEDTPEALAEISNLALKAYQLLGCSGWGRVDLMRDNQGKAYLLEVNTSPGMTSHSLVPKAALSIGISFETLVRAILATTMVSQEAYACTR